MYKETEIMKLFSILFIFLLYPSLPFTQEINFTVQGISDEVKNSKQRDRDEAIMDAKLKAIEKSGVNIKSITIVENFVLKRDLIESKAEAIILPGFQLIEIGYGQDGLYHVVISGILKIANQKNSMTKDSLLIEYFFSEIENGNLNKVKHMIENGFNPNWVRDRSHYAIDIYGKRRYAADTRPAIYHATLYKQFQIVKYLLLKGANASAVDQSGDSAINEAARGDMEVTNQHGGYIEILQELIRYDANVNNQGGNEGYSPLHCAAHYNNSTTVRILLSNGANLDLRNDRGQTPLEVAEWMGNIHIIKILRAAGASR